MDTHEFTFDTLEKGVGHWCLETNLLSEEVLVVVEEVIGRINGLMADEIGDLSIRVGIETVFLRHRTNYDRCLGYAPDDGRNLYGSDLHVGVQFPIIDTDMHPDTKRMAKRIVEEIFRAIDGYGLSDKVCDRKGF